MGIEFDIVIVVKVFGNGIFVGVMIGGKEFGMSFIVGLYGLIFGGNYIVMVVVKEVL